MSQHPESIAGLATAWAGPAAAWIANAAVWALGGMSPLAALGAIAAGNTAYLRYKKVTSQR